MEDFLLGLVGHLNVEAINTSIKTIETYQGQIKDLLLHRGKLPAALVRWEAGMPFRQNAEGKIVIYVITDSAILNRQERTNLSRADLIGQYLADNSQWQYESKSYWIDPKQITTQTIIADNKTNIIGIVVTINSKN